VVVEVVAVVVVARGAVAEVVAEVVAVVVGAAEALSLPDADAESDGAVTSVPLSLSALAHPAVATIRATRAAGRVRMPHSALLLGHTPGPNRMS
jgi:hypothetical protein